jgi:hypothetical protein
MEFKKEFPTSFLKPSKYNPRIMEEKEHEKLDEVIEYFGLVDPIIFNTKTGVIIGGNQRFEHIKHQEQGFALLLGDIGWFFTEDDLKLESEADEKALNLALNKITGYFDEPLLVPMLEEIIEADDIPIVFDDVEISDMLGIGFGDVPVDDDKPKGEGNEEFEEFVEKHKTATFYLKEGDEWWIGSHKLIVGEVDEQSQKINVTLKGSDLRITVSSTENVDEEMYLFQSNNKKVIKTNKPDYDDK